MALTKKEKGIIAGVVVTAIIAGVAITRAEAAPREYCCPYCDQCFPNYKKLVDHVTTAHPGERIPLPIDWD